MKDGIISFFNLVHIGLVYVAKLMMVAMVLIIFSNVVLRYVFNSGLMWSEEVALLLAVWFIFIAMSLGVKQNLHINITLFPESRQPRWLRKALGVLKSAAVLVVAITMLVHGWKLVGFTMQSIMPATQWPAGLLYAILPVSAVIMIYESLMDILGVDTRDQAVDAFLAGKGSLKDVLGGIRG
jgi:TRAP-type C4-dicarboxylate transport system permease small subunit